MVQRPIAEVPEPIVLPSEETVNRRIKIKLIDFDAEIARLNLQSLESSRKMIQDLEQINHDGVHTLAALEDQDEQLDKIEENLSKVNENLNVVSNNVNNMDQYCGCNIFKLIRNPFKMCKKRERDAIKDEILEKMTSKPSSSKNDETFITFRSSNKRKESASEYIKRLTCDTIEDELEKNLMQIDQNLESVKNLAVDMHVQLKIQEPKLNRIEELTETNDKVVEGVNDKVQKMLH